MEKIILTLFKDAQSDDLEISNGALTDLGLIIERHKQNRYDDSSYELLFNNKDLFIIKNSENEIEIIISFLFYYIMNFENNSVTVAWCLGKCYNCNILIGIKKLFIIFDSDDEVSLQLLYSINSIYNFSEIKIELDTVINKIISENKLKNTVEYLTNLKKQ